MFKLKFNRKKNTIELPEPYKTVFERENSLGNIAHLRISSILFIVFLVIILLNNTLHQKGLMLSYPYFYFNLLYIINSLVLMVFFVLFLLIENRFIKSLLAIHGIIFSFAIAMLLYSVFIAMLDQSISGQIIIYMLISLALAVGVVEKPKLLFPAFFFAQIVFASLLPIFQRVPKVLISNMINSFLLTMLSLYISRMFYNNRMHSYLHAKELEAANNDLIQLNEKLTTTMNTLVETQSLLFEKEKMAVLGSLIAGVTHEINTPLAVVKSNINLEKLLLDSLLEASNSDDLEILKENAANFYQISMEGVSRINRLVKTLNAFIHLDEAAYKAVDINKGIENTVALLREQFNQSLRIDLRLAELPLLICHPAQINQAIMSLLHYRARKMNGTGRILVRSELRGNYIHIKFSDYGPYISPEERMRIFNPALDAKTDKIELNMDLTISYKIIERHRGSIIIESAPDHGTDIHIELPVNS